LAAREVRVTWILLMGTAVALAMDACAVALSLAMREPAVRPRQWLPLCAVFGGFQALMPALGYGLGASFAGHVARWGPWLAGGLVCVLGIKMALECWRGDGARESQDGRWPGTRQALTLGVATSLDALAVGVSFGLIGAPLVPAVLTIGVVTALLTALAVQIGRRVGASLGRGAEGLGGAVLIAIGIKIFAGA